MSHDQKSFIQFAFDTGFFLALIIALGTVLCVDSFSPRPMSLDLVFILDEAGALGQFADKVKTSWEKLASSLSGDGYSCRFAAISCSLHEPAVPSIDWQLSAQDFSTALTTNDPDTLAASQQAADCLSALEIATKLQFRKDAIGIVILVTDNIFPHVEESFWTRLQKTVKHWVKVPYENRNLNTNSFESEQTQLSRIVAQLRKNNTRAVVSADASQRAFFYPLFERDGQFFSLAGENLTGKVSSMGNLFSHNITSELKNIRPAEGILKGIKVQGRLALVCDTSGSMSQDFPPLVKELRAKFPANTPLFLVEGCHFYPPGASEAFYTAAIDAEPERVHGIESGVDFDDDKHVYRCVSTLDAIALAVKKFRCNTVILNNDMQDGGSQLAVSFLKSLHDASPFVLSVRSLNCDAPIELKQFIRATRGQFKLDVISRLPDPAIEWQR
jgi:hypothetical protein